MKTTPTPKPDPKEIMARMQQGLGRVCTALPHLSDLAGSVRLQIEPRVPTAGIFASGRLVMNPSFAAALDQADMIFVLAHELMHLALKTHERGMASDPLIVNYAHDYIINDMLAHDLGRPVPAFGLIWPNARLLSLEKLINQLEQMRECLPPQSWNQPNSPPPFPGAGQVKMPQSGDESTSETSAGARHQQPPRGDVLPSELERLWYPDVNAQQQGQQQQKVQEATARANVLNVLRDALMTGENQSQMGQQQTGGNDYLAASTKYAYHPPWEYALQRWFEAVSTRTRSFARPSRRGAQRRDVVLPGRIREGWTLHIILDCSGSMYADLPVALGAIAAFCEASDVELVHVLQCDVQVTREEWVAPQELTQYQITGLGGTDMTPAIRKLAEDPEVEAVLVLTDQDVLWAPLPQTPPPYDLLWVLMRQVPGFNPPFGRVVCLEATAPSA